MHLSRAMTAGGRSAVAIAIAWQERPELGTVGCSSCLNAAARIGVDVSGAQGRFRHALDFQSGRA
jgi:hypothetical protein